MPSGRAARARPPRGRRRRLPRAVHRRLSAEDLVSSRRSRRPAAPPSRTLARETGDGGPAILIGTPWVEAAISTTLGGACRRAHQAMRHKVDLPNYGVFDEKRVFARAAAGAGQFPRRAYRHPDLRGHLVGRLRTWSNASPRRAEKSCWCRTARRIGAARSKSGSTSRRARHRGGPAADLCQPGRRPGRVGVRGRVVRAQCRSLDPGPAAGLPRGSRHHALGAGAAAWRCVRADVASRGSRQGRLRGLRARLARLCRQDRLQRRRARAFGRHRFGAVRAIAVDALGAKRVRCLMLPYRYTAQESLDDAR